MKKILSIALLFISIISHAQTYTPIHTVGSATYLDSNKGSALISKDLILLQYKTSDSTQVLGIDSNGHIVLRTKGGGTAIVDSTVFGTHFYINSQGFLKSTDITGKLNKSDSNLLSGYFSYFAWLRDSSLIMNNFSNYATLTQLTNALAPYATIASTWSRTQIDSILTAKAYETVAHAAATYYPLSNPANYITITPVNDTAAAHLALINSKVSLAKHTADSEAYYLSLGDTASAIRAYIASLPNYGISPTDITHWNTAYNKYIASISFNPSTGALTITLNDATTVSANLDGRYLKSADWVADSTAIWAAINTKASTIKVQADSSTIMSVVNTKVDTTKYRVDSSRVIRQGGDARSTPDTIGTNDNNGIVFKVNNSPQVFISSSGLMGIGAPSDGNAALLATGHRIAVMMSSPNQNAIMAGYSGNYYLLTLGDGSTSFGYQFPGAPTCQIGIQPTNNTKVAMFIKDFDTTTSNNVDLVQFQSKTGRILSRVTHTGGFVIGDTTDIKGFVFFRNVPDYTTGIDSMLVWNHTTQRIEKVVIPSGGGSGTVTSIATSKGILGGTITTSGTLIVDTVGTSGTAVASQAWVTNKGYLTTNQTTTLSGDITGSGTTAITTTIGAGKVTNAMLAGSIDLTSKVTNALPIANGGTGQTTANAALNALLPSQATNSGKFITTDGINTSWGTPAGGGGGGVAGQNGSVQFDSAGVQAGSPNVKIDLTDKNLNFTPNNGTGVIAAPSTGAKLYMENNLGKAFFHVVDTLVKSDIALQESIGDADVSLVKGVLDGSGNPSGFGILREKANFSASSFTGMSYSATNELPNKNTIRISTGASAGTSQAFYFSYATANITSARYNGGVVLKMQFGLSGYASTERLFVGYEQVYGGAWTNVDPSTEINIIGLGKDAADATFQWMVNDGSGVATKTNTGVTPNQNDMYELTIVIPSGGGTVSMQLIDKTTTTITPTTVYTATTNIPAAGTQISPKLNINNGSVAASRTADFIQCYQYLIN